jgi:hypothetical protein
MHRSIEFSLDLTAQELLAPSALTPTVEVEDIEAVAVMSAFAANSDHARHDEDAIELELTAEEMDALLDGRWQPR